MNDLRKMCFLKMFAFLLFAFLLIFCCFFFSLVTVRVVLPFKYQTAANIETLGPFIRGKIRTFRINGTFRLK